MFTQLPHLILIQLLNAGILPDPARKNAFRHSRSRLPGGTLARGFRSASGTYYASAKTPLENRVIYGENASRVLHAQQNLGKPPYVSSGKSSPIRENAFRSRSRLPGGTLARGSHSASGIYFASVMMDAHSANQKHAGKTPYRKPP
jgi:hypothetical protein